MFENISSSSIFKAILSDKVKDSIYKKATLKRIKIKDSEMFQLEYFTDKQAFQKNVEINDGISLLEEYMKYFKQAQIYTKEYVYGFRISSKGKILSNKKKNSETFVVLKNDREKKYLLEEGIPVPALVDLGVMTKDGKIVKSYMDKYRQINKFLELIYQTIKNEKKTKLNIIDFGCGKSYLTFIVYHFLTNVLNLDITMTGLDLKEDVIKECNEIAIKYNYHNLHFEIGDISLYKPKEYCDMIITLHACDVATDFAMYHAIKLKTKYLLSVPCCQHEINLELKKNNLEVINKYGLLKERFSALLTDSIRCNILEYFGYKVQACEFVDFASSPKNILIKATLTNNKNEESLKLVENILKEYDINQTLYDLCFKKKE
jgi:hypothetical protein